MCRYIDRETKNGNFTRQTVKFSPNFSKYKNLIKFKKNVQLRNRRAPYQKYNFKTTAIPPPPPAKAVKEEQGPQNRGKGVMKNNNFPFCGSKTLNCEEVQYLLSELSGPTRYHQTWN